MIKKVILISCSQYGYHTDMYQYAKYLSQIYKVIYICMDQGLDKVDNITGVNIVYLDSDARKTKFIKLCNMHIEQEKPYSIIIDYFVRCSFIASKFKMYKTILDIRTATISNNILKKKLRDLFIKIESTFFKGVIILSNGLREELSISKQKSEVVPLGADRQIDYNKMKVVNSKIGIVYVGTFDNRNILDCVKAFHKLCEKNNSFKNKLILNLVGYSNNGEDKKINCYINENNIDNIVMHGRIKNQELSYIWEQNSIGLSYVPMTKYFMNQPPTKTFEYLANGLICIATRTKYNKSVINDYNGICINDNVDGLLEGIEKVVNDIDNYDRINISKAAEIYSWKSIVNNDLIPFIEKI